MTAAPSDGYLNNSPRQQLPYVGRHLRRVRSYGTFFSDPAPESSDESSDDEDSLDDDWSTLSIWMFLRSPSAIRESRRMIAQAVPQALNLMCMNLNTLVVTLMAARQSAVALAAIGLSHAIIFGSALLLSGTLAVVPVLAAQTCAQAEKEEDAGNTASAARLYVACGNWLRSGVMGAVCFVAPAVVLLWCSAGLLLEFMDICSADVQSQVAILGRASIVWILPFVLTVAITGWIEAVSSQESLPWMVPMLVLPFTALFAVWAVPRYSMYGAALAMTIQYSLSAFILIVHISRRQHLAQMAFAPCTSCVSSLAGKCTSAIVVLRQGLPVALTEIAQDWHLLLAQIAASMHSTHAGGAVALMTGLVSVIVCPLMLSISGGLAAKITSELHEGSSDAAIRTLSVGMATSLTVTCACCVLLWLSFSMVGKLFNYDHDLSEQFQLTVNRSSLLACGSCVVCSVGHPVRAALYSQGRCAETVWVSAVLAGVMVVITTGVLTSVEDWGGAFPTWIAIFMADLCSTAFLGYELWRTDWAAEAERVVHAYRVEQQAFAAGSEKCSHEEEAKLVPVAVQMQELFEAVHPVQLMMNN